MAVALLPLWQLVQFVDEVKVLWSTLADDHEVADLWQVSHTVTPLWIGVPGLPTAGGKLPVWQVAHCLVTATEAWNVAGAHAPNPALWQLSQLAIDTPESDWYGMWLAGLPSAGGKPPVWQLVHWLVTATWVWFHADGRQALNDRWQLSQAAPELTGMCWALLPVARDPLWQVAHVPATTAAWSKPVAGSQAVVLWQLSQDAVVWMWLDVLPLVMALLWQFEQVPACTALWLKRPLVKVWVPWQVSHDCVVGMWFCVITTLVRAQREPVLWQEVQSRGVPLKVPLR